MIQIQMAHEELKNEDDKKDILTRGWFEFHGFEL